MELAGSNSRRDTHFIYIHIYESQSYVRRGRRERETRKQNKNKGEVSKVVFDAGQPVQKRRGYVEKLLGIV